MPLSREQEKHQKKFENCIRKVGKIAGIPKECLPRFVEEAMVIIEKFAREIKNKK